MMHHKQQGATLDSKEGLTLSWELEGGEDASCMAHLNKVQPSL